MLPAGAAADAVMRRTGEFSRFGDPAGHGMRGAWVGRRRAYDVILWRVDADRLARAQLRGEERVEARAD